MIRFANPYFFTLLALVAVIICFYIRRERGKRGSIKYSDVKSIKAIPLSPAVHYRHVLIVLRVLVVVLLICGLARPQKGRKESELITKGVDILLCLDISGTMQAEDFKPENRFEAAKKVIRDFVKGRRNDRLGLVVFSAQSFTQCPLTLDYGVLLEFLDKIHLGMIQDGTAIGMAIANCVNRLRDSDAKSKVVILLTDGENNAGEIDPITAARAAAALTIKIYTIGMGKEGGAPIPFQHPIFGKQYYRNQDGSLYLTKIDEPTLQEIAYITKANYYRATDTDKLQDIYQKIGELEKTKIKTKEYMDYDEKFYLFLIGALLLLMLEIVLANTRFRKIP